MANLEADKAILQRAMDALKVHWDQVAIFTNRFDPTTEATSKGTLCYGNVHGILDQIDRWRDAMEDAMDGECSCGSCETEEADEDEPEFRVGDDDETDDTRGNC